MTPALIAVLLLAVIAVATVILGHSLETDRQAEQMNQERFMRNIAFTVLDDLGAELFALYSAFSFDLSASKEPGRRPDRTMLDRVIQRYRAQARFPDLLEEVVTLSLARDGTYRYDAWSSGWFDRRRPAWVPDLELRGPLFFSLSKPVLTLFLKNRRPAADEVVAVALRFNPQIIVQKMVPALVGLRLAELGESQAYRAGVRNLSLKSDEVKRGDVQVPLLPWTVFEAWSEYYLARLQTLDRSPAAFERSIQAPSLEGDLGTGWALTVLRPPHGLGAEMESWKWRNLGLCAGFFLILTWGLVGLYSLTLRTRRLAQQERTFLGLISHELKTPLAVIRSLSDNLAQGLTTDRARVQEYGEVLLEESERLGRMIGNVLGLTAIQGGIAVRDRVPVVLEDLVRDRLAREVIGEDVELVVSIHPGLPPVLGQTAALSAAVDNLIGNAFRHGTTGTPPHQIRIMVVPRRRWGVRGVELSIEDNGPGFSTLEGWALHRPFHRGKGAQDLQAPGGGVGLSLVQTTAEALGGHLKWVGRRGRGARFVLWLREAPP